MRLKSTPRAALGKTIEWRNWRAVESPAGFGRRPARVRGQRSAELTCAETFGEFVEEIRLEQRSHVLLMPQYTEPVTSARRGRCSM
jgi:hypothetical protein